MSSDGIYMRWSDVDVSKRVISPAMSSGRPIEKHMAFGSASAGSPVGQMIMHLFSRYILRIFREYDLFWLYLHDMCCRRTTVCDKDRQKKR